MHSLIIFASGAGTNTDAIINYFRNNQLAKVALIVCNKANAGVLKIAQREQIPYLVVNKESFESPLVVEQMLEYHPSLVVLAGFMWKVPEHILHAFQGKIINIHPALLPSYGGKGMYGTRVHDAVIAAGDSESGITVHYVNEHYDMGNIIVQARCEVNPGDSIAALENKIHALEYFYLPRAIQFLLEQRKH